MDQMREAQEKERQRADEERRLQEEKQRLEEEKSQKEEAAVLETKRLRLKEEPPAGEAGRLQLVLRLPNGARLQRAFRCGDLVGLIYDLVDVQELDVLKRKEYRLISNMPRKVFDDRALTLESAGIANQSVLMVET